MNTVTDTKTREDITKSIERIEKHIKEIKTTVKHEKKVVIIINKEITRKTV